MSPGQRRGSCGQLIVGFDAHDNVRDAEIKDLVLTLVLWVEQFA